MKTAFTIQAKASALFLLLFIVIILPINWIIFRNMKKTLEDASRQEMEVECDKLMSSVRLDPLTIPLSSTYDIRLSYLKENEITFEVLFASPGFPRVDDGFEGYIVRDTVESLTVEKNFSDIHGTFYLSIARSSDHLQVQLAELKQYLFGLTTASVAFAGLLVYLAAGVVLRPLRMIATAASRIKASDAIERIPVPATRDESRTLAEALNAMLDRIETAIRNQTNFFASATHELKTPIAVMKAQLSLDNSHPDLAVEIERLDRVISDFLLISQLKSDSLVIRKQLFALDEILYQSLKKVHRLSIRENLRMNVTIHEEAAPFTAEIDVDKMEIVFTNILENAARYTCDASFEITLSATDAAFRFLVTNKTEMTVEQPELLTREFTKSKEFSEGLGMGLWICNEILKRHDARLELTSNRLIFMVLVEIPKAAIREKVGV